MYMVVVEQGLQTYLLALPHKDQAALWLAQTDITAQLDLLNIGQVLSGQFMEVFLLHQ
jgi:hypothetical protein